MPLALKIPLLFLTSCVEYQHPPIPLHPSQHLHKQCQNITMAHRVLVVKCSTATLLVNVQDKYWRLYCVYFWCNQEQLVCSLPAKLTVYLQSFSLNAFHSSTPSSLPSHIVCSPLKPPSPFPLLSLSLALAPPSNLSLIQLFDWHVFGLWSQVAVNRRSIHIVIYSRLEDVSRRKTSDQSELTSVDLCGTGCNK